MEAVRDHHEVTQDAIYESLRLALGLTEEEAVKMIRYSMPDGESQPFNDLKPDENRCYIRISSITLGGMGGRDRLHENNKVSGGLTKTVQVLDGLSAMLMFYGPKAVQYAERAYVLMHEDEARQVLREARLAIVVGGPMPVYLPELVNGNWVTRCDLDVRLYRMIEYRAEVPAIEVGPDIILRREK